jgi:hypothetical protein
MGYFCNLKKLLKENSPNLVTLNATHFQSCDLGKILF